MKPGKHWPLYAVLIMLIAVGGYSIHHPTGKAIKDMTTNEKYMYYQKAADALFDTLYELDEHNQGIPVDMMYRYDLLYDSAWKYKLLDAQTKSNL